MTLIINIPDDEYKILKSTGAWNSGLIECVKNGTPLGAELNCPRCGLEVHRDFKQCPRCGADMRGE